MAVAVSSPPPLYTLAVFLSVWLLLPPTLFWAAMIMIARVPAHKRRSWDQESASPCWVWCAPS
eukprot:CAMPEP_0181210176 /NCGR_PEP_ID=MMETSP1096-20121128/23082_1 /TAXON_ID=156174 ORGANISM="Chrysochromulina ericina, Strain CCMP281" /NCGR_SAMPLE_ID=MMETSP1096 /ASSEMBLY_ACC=CAM_ASM_000453 /LENGTH=62 /DNA_ID=CAMNT_0023301431 /DNA_START=173 /DNA_END=361 /DNA_ORIENTATION=+